MAKTIKKKERKVFRMKKVLAMLLITAMVLGVTGCSGGTDTATEDTAATTEDSGGETADAETDDAAAATGDTVKIGVLLPFSGRSSYRRTPDAWYSDVCGSCKRKWWY